MNQPFVSKSICVLAAAMTALLSACSSLPKQNLTAGTTDNVSAQTALSTAISKQMRTSFDFRTDFYPSNAIREQALNAASDEQLSASDDRLSVCEDQHDKAYLNLAKQQLSQGKTPDQIDTAKPEFTAIYEAYQACVNQREGKVSLPLPDADEFLQNTADKQPTEQLDLLWQAYQQTLSEQEQQTSENQANYLADYDGDHTALDRKKAQLLQAYLLTPTKLSTTGNYRPLSGQISLLPVFEYDHKNLQLMLAQPLHLDVRQGVLYVWADALAAVNSETIDKQLGDQWYQKWLAIPLNDGSLPKGFADNLVKFIINAKKQSQASLPADAFAWVQAEQVLGVPYLTQNLPANAVNTIKQSNQIIQSRPNLSAREYARYLFADSLYQDIVRTYPELAREFAMQDRQIVDGDFHIAVETQGEQTTNPESKLSSRMLIDLLLVYLQNISHAYQAQVSEMADKTENFEPMTHYGFSHNRLQWVHQRQYLRKTALTGGQLQTTAISSQEPMFIDSFTIINNQSNQSVFANLPVSAQQPNAQNSVNLFEYGNDLAKRVQAGENNYLKTLFALIFGDDTQIESDLPSE